MWEEMKLVLVESPKKCQSLSKILGPGYTVLGCAGHFMELSAKGGSGPRSKYGIDIMNGFKPLWTRTAAKQKFMSKIKDAARGASEVIIATDDDREGEAIGWHLIRELRLNPATTHRIIFQNITEEEIKRAMSLPTRLNQQRVDAALARQISDKIVGYELSPVLWRHLGRGLSAGRVQSVVTRLIVDHEKCIKGFQSKGYYTIDGTFTGSGPGAGTNINANYNVGPGTGAGAGNSKIENLAVARTHMEAILPHNTWSIASITPRMSKRSPPAPFVTSSLQQEASNRFGWTPKHTMKIAQSLYEGGHITYMRTDSSVLSDEAIASIKGFVLTNWGPDYHEARQFTKSAKGSQEAHEAIRPTKIGMRALSGHDGQETRLYDLVWKRTVASQMSPEQVRTTTYTLHAQPDLKDQLLGTFNHKRVESLFPGYKILYNPVDEEGDGEVGGGGGDGDGPSSSFYDTLSVGYAFLYKKVEAHEGATNPPSRFTEASLIKKMEDKGIGRPSTWSSMVDKIQSRTYVVKKDIPGHEVQLTNLVLEQGSKTVKEVAIKSMTKSENKKLVPTELGIMITEFLEREFPEIMDYGFTAEMETELDMICQGTKPWQDVVNRYWQGLDPIVTTLSKKEADGGIKRERDRKERLLGATKDGRNVSVTVGKWGPCIRVDATTNQKAQFWGLESGQTLATLTLDQALRIISIPKEGKALGSDIILKNGRYGYYIQAGTASVTIPPGTDPYTLTLDTAQKLLQNSGVGGSDSARKVVPGVGELIPDGRYGPYLKLEKGGNLGLKKLKVSLQAFMEMSDEDAKKLVETASVTTARSGSGRGSGRGSGGRGRGRGRGGRGRGK